MKKYISFLILGFIVIFNAKSQDYSGYTRVAEQDSLALVALYNATDGPNWYSNQDGFGLSNLGDDVLVYHQTTYPYAGMGKWLVGPVKDWFGVLLEKQPGGNSKDSVWRVVHLRATINRRSAGNNNLKGYVPKEVGLLTALKWFKINGNIGLSPTELPDEVYHPSLLQLDIEGANMGGIITDAIRKCTKLEFINLRYNFWDSIPTFDFFSKEHLLDKFLGTNIFIYSTRISYATWEPSVDYFTTFTTEADKIKYQIQNQDQVGREKEIVVKAGDTVTLVCNEAGKQGKCTWEKKGMNTYKTGTTYTINNITASDTGTYKGLVENDYIKAWQTEGSGGVGQAKTKPIRVVFTPSTPACKSAKTSYSGNEIELTFSKAMAEPSTLQTSQFAVTRNGRPVNVSSISRTGRLSDILQLKLDSSVLKGEVVTISYTKGTVADSNNGQLNSFSNKAVANLVRPTPHLIDAISRTDGDGIVLTFDQYIDASSLTESDFKISSTDATQKITGIILTPGEIDNGISKKITLALANPLKVTDNIQVSYTKGSMIALYGAAVQSFGYTPVTISLDPNRTFFNITFKDGSKSMKNIVVKGNLRIMPFAMENKGINGDFQDWQKKVSVTNGTYNWSVYERKSTTTYDTTISVDPNTGVKTILLTPNTIINDSLLSEAKSLIVTTSNGTFTGDTVFSIFDKVLTFQLVMKNYIQNHPTEVIEPYLMGLKNDWVNGIQMSRVNDTLYTASVGGYNVDDVIYFNFRNGSVWENSTPEKQSHKVTGNDIIKRTFGEIITSITKTSNEGRLLVYPNPADNNLFVSVDFTNALTSYKIYNVFGECLMSEKLADTNIDIHQLSKGLYILILTDKNGKNYKSSFVKN